jgi:anti-sigma factor RsiW
MLYCEDVELMLQDYLNGYLLHSQRDLLEAHVRGCDQCRELVAGLSRLESRLDGIDDVEVPAGLTSAILAALPPHAYRPSPWRRAIVWGAAPVLALLLAAVGFLAKDRFQIQGRLAAREVEVTLSAPQAVSVAVVGDFNNWDPQRTRLVRSNHEGLWRARLKLVPGVYQYSFVLDGSAWVSDPLAKTLLSDGFGGKNSVIIVDG